MTIKNIIVVLGAAHGAFAGTVSPPKKRMLVLMMKLLICAAIFAGIFSITSSAARAEYVMATTIFGHQVYVTKQPGENS